MATPCESIPRKSAASRMRVVISAGSLIMPQASKMAVNWRPRSSGGTIMGWRDLDESFLGLVFQGQGLAPACQQTQIAPHRDHRVAVFHPMPRVRLNRSKDARGFAGLADTVPGIFNCRTHLRVIGISQMAQGGGEIAWADEQSIDAFDGGNRFDLAQGGDALDLHEDAKLVADPLQVIMHPAIAVGAMQNGDTSDAPRRITCCGDSGTRFVRILHERDQQVLRTNVQKALDENDVVPGWANHRRGGAADEALQLA